MDYNQMRVMTRCVLGWCSLMVWASAPVLAAEEWRRCITVVGTSDLHGAIEPHQLVVDKQAKSSLRYGGLMVQASYIGTLRQRHPGEVILLDAGDLYQGTMVSNLSRGRAVTLAYNALGLDAAAVGNHEFDYGPLSAGGADRLGVFKKRIGESRFPFLAVNIRRRLSGKPVDWAKPSVLLERNGIQVGIIGAATVETPRVTRPENVVGLDFVDPVPPIIAEAAVLRRAGAQVVVLVAHMGGACAATSDPADLSTCTTTSEMFATLQRLPRGTIDVAVGGHTHAFVAHRVNGVAVIQAGARGRQLAWVRICLADAGGSGTTPHPQRGHESPLTVIHPPIDMCLETFSNGSCRRGGGSPPLKRANFLGLPVRIDPTLQALMAPFIAQVATVQNRAIQVTLPRPLRRGDANSHRLGTLVAESLRLAAGADVAVQNVGGVRADLPAGSLRYGQLFEVLPFGNKLATVTLSGTDLIKVVRALIRRRAGEAPYVAGLQLSRDSRGDWQILCPDGSPPRPDRSYVLATNDFLVNGGEGLHTIFGRLPADAVHTTDLDMREALIALLRQRFPSSAGAGPAGPEETGVQ